ncbi:hypothetical protein K9L27_00940 [Candidatus Gracilibacteria bacterium]|nr:hypothetical protein [Candidatus Gracilibacteria bacterium]
MSNDFLTQIQKAELDAEKLIQKAQEKAQHGVQDERQKLVKEREQHLDDARVSAKKRLSEKQKEMRKLYDDMVKEGQRSAQTLQNECKPKMEKVLTTASLYLLNDLI